MKSESVRRIIRIPLRFEAFSKHSRPLSNRFEAKRVDYQAEAEKNRFAAGKDASNGIVANLLRDDSAGRAGAASAALGNPTWTG
jgi:hypothetical protein